MMKNPKCTIEFHGFQKIAILKKTVMSQMNTDGIRERLPLAQYRLNAVTHPADLSLR